MVTEQMASSRGRARLAERSQKRFAFGSSTPRELSHISVPPVFRAIDAKSQREIAQRSQSSSSVLANSLLLMAKPKVNLSFYLRQAHSSHPLTRSESAHAGKPFAFGSSTPREFSHLNKIRPALRVYDAKIVHKAQQKPTHSPSLSVTTRRPRSISHNARHVIEKVEDDIASEPDIVQDRRYDFSEYREQHRQQKLENEKKELKSRTSTAEENTLEVEEQTQELSTEAQQSVQVMKQADEILPHDHLVTVPVVQAPEMANPVLLEDNHVENFEENDANHSYEVKNLGDLADLDLVTTLSQESGRYKKALEDHEENE